MMLFSLVVSTGRQNLAMFVYRKLHTVRLSILGQQRGVGVCLNHGFKKRDWSTIEQLAVR
jgi:hypothetical protein